MVEADFLAALARASWVTFQIATLGSLLAALMALPLACWTARNLRAQGCWPMGPRPCWTTRAVHTLVFGLILVGIVGWGPRPECAGHRAALHGHLRQAVCREHRVAGHGAVDAVRATGAVRRRSSSSAVWPSVLPQFVSSHLYVWEFNIRDSTILGLIGAGGLGLLI
jgi:phosphonate transport system permease protein